MYVKFLRILKKGGTTTNLFVLYQIGVEINIPGSFDKNRKTGIGLYRSGNETISFSDTVLAITLHKCRYINSVFDIFLNVIDVYFWKNHKFSY